MPWNGPYHVLKRCLLHNEEISLGRKHLMFSILHKTVISREFSSEGKSARKYSLIFWGRTENSGGKIAGYWKIVTAPIAFLSTEGNNADPEWKPQPFIGTYSSRTSAGPGNGIQKPRNNAAKALPALPECWFKNLPYQDFLPMKWVNMQFHHLKNYRRSRRKRYAQRGYAAQKNCGGTHRPPQLPNLTYQLYISRNYRLTTLTLRLVPSV